MSRLEGKVAAISGGHSVSSGVVDTPMLDPQATTPEAATAIREGSANYALS
jgi:hypothetical protein